MIGAGLFQAAVKRCKVMQSLVEFNACVVKIARHFRSHIYVKELYINKFQKLWEIASTTAIRKLDNFTLSWQMTEHFNDFKRRIASVFFDVEVNKRLLQRFENDDSELDYFDKAKRQYNCKELTKVTKAKSYYIFVEVLRCLKSMRDQKKEKPESLNIRKKESVFAPSPNRFSTPKSRKREKSPGIFNKLLIQQTERSKFKQMNLMDTSSSSLKKTPTSRESPIRSKRKMMLQSNKLALLKVNIPDKAFELKKHVVRDDVDEFELSPSRHIPKSRLIMGIKSVQSAQDIATQVHRLKMIILESNHMAIMPGQTANNSKSLLRDLAKSSPSMSRIKRSLSVYTKIIDEKKRQQVSLRYAADERHSLLQIICDKFSRRSKDRLHCSIDAQAMLDIVMTAYVIVTKYDY